MNLSKLERKILREKCLLLAPIRGLMSVSGRYCEVSACASLSPCEHDKILGWVYVMRVEGDYRKGGQKTRFLIKVGKAKFSERSHVFERLHAEKSAFRALGWGYNVKTKTGSQDLQALKEFFAVHYETLEETDLICLIAVYAPDNLEKIETMVRELIGKQVDAKKEAKRQHEEHFGFPINDLALSIILKNAGATTEIVECYGDFLNSLWCAFSNSLSLAEFTFAEFRMHVP